MLRALIIDDEPLARDLVRQFLKDFSHLEIIGECADGFAALKMIQDCKPDVLFLDVQMPKITGFELLELLTEPPIVIFTTAYNEYALKAFEMNALDYLLKPFSKERFAQAVQKATDAFRNHSPQPYQKLNEDYSKLESKLLQRVVVKDGPKIHVIPVENIQYVEAQDDYVMLYTSDAKYLKQQTMKYFESVLDPAVFVRIHRSYIANIRFISRLEHYEKDAYRLILHSQKALSVSKSGYYLLKNILNI